MTVFASHLWSSLPFGFFRSPDINRLHLVAFPLVSWSSLPFGFFRSPDRSHLDVGFIFVKCLHCLSASFALPTDRSPLENKFWAVSSSLPFGFFRSPDKKQKEKMKIASIISLHCLSASFALPTFAKKMGIAEKRPWSSLPFGFFRSPDHPSKFRASFTKD